MKNNIFTLAIAITILFTSLAACKRDKDKDNVPDDSSEQTTVSSDESRISNEADQALDDANTVLSGSSLAGAKTAAASICGATIDSTNKANGIIVLNFDGTTTCINGTRTRSGAITLSLPAGTKWTDVGAKLTVTFTNYKVTRVSDSKSVTLAGTKTITNVNGGLIRNLTNGSSLVHKVRGDLTVTFDDNTQRNWKIARLRTIALSGNIYTITIEGDTTISGTNDVDVWGKNRYGNEFQAAITEPIVIKSSCDWHATDGIKIHKGLQREITITFGVDQSGNEISSGCPYGYKINWTNIRNESKHSVIQY